MILGLTGAVGAGKSTLAAILAQRGFAVLDVDEVAAACARQRGLSAREALEAVLSQEGSPHTKSLVEDVLAFIEDWCRRSSGPRVIDTALLFEHGVDTLCDATLCVTCPQDERRRRVEARASASAQRFSLIEQSQWPEAEKKKRATWTLENFGDLSMLADGLESIAATPTWRQIVGA